MNKQVVAKLNHIIITIIFGITIYVPFLIGIFAKDKTISQVEKRELSSLPEIPNSIGELKSFPQSFNDYYSDHIGLRNLLIKYYRLVKFTIGDSPSPDVTLGKNDWLFLGSIQQNYNRHHDPVGDARHVNLYSPENLEKFAQYLVDTKNWLKDRGIEYLFVIAPNKHTIYFDQLPNYVRKVNEKSAMDQIIEYLEEHTDVSVVDLRPALMKYKDKKQLYYKTDTHWNHFGDNIAQYEIMKKIEQLFPNQIEPEMIQDFKYIRERDGDLANFMGLNTIQEFLYEPIFQESCAVTKEPPDAKQKDIHTFICEGQKLNALIFRDSFFENLKPYFSRKFKRSTYIWNKLNHSYLTQYVELEKPDIVIDEFVERNLPYIPQDVLKKH